MPCGGHGGSDTRGPIDGTRTLRGNQAAYRKYVEGLIEKEDDLLRAARDKSHYATGDERFVGETEDELKQARLSKGVGGDIVWPPGRRVAREVIEAAVEREFGVRAEALRTHGRRAGVAKAVALELCCRLTGETQRAIARHFGYGSESAVGKQRKRLAALCGRQTDLEQRVQTLISACSSAKV